MTSCKNVCLTTTELHYRSQFLVKKSMETVNNEWPTLEDRISEIDNAYTMSEFICIQCRNSL